MAVKVIVEGTGRAAISPGKGEVRAFLLTERVQRRIDAGYYREVERVEIADHTPPPEPTSAENPSAGPEDSGSTQNSDDSPEPPADDRTSDTAGEPEAKVTHRPRRGKTTPADG